LSPRLRLARGIALALAIGGLGGFVFYLMHLPLAWMLGAMAFTCVAAIGGAPLAMPPHVRSVMIAVLGTMIGSSFGPEVLERMGSWLGGLAASIGFVAVITAVVYAYLRRFGRLDRPTALFAATPGGLGEMTLIGERNGGDPRTISLVHACRILVVVFTIPFYMRYVVGFETPRLAAFAAGTPIAGPGELALLALVAASGFAVTRLIRLPSAQLIGPLLFSAGAYAIGLVEGRPPMTLVAGAQVIVGAAVGARFVGFPLVLLAKVMGLAVGSGLLMVLGAEVFALAAAPVLGIDRYALLLALAPGGLAEMSLVALSVNADTAFVSTMHFGRILVIVLAVPLLFRLFGRRGAAM